MYVSLVSVILRVRQSQTMRGGVVGSIQSAACENKALVVGVNFPGHSASISMDGPAAKTTQIILRHSKTLN